MRSHSGEKDIPGLTDTTVPRRLGPKRASKIRKLFNLSKEDDVRQYVVRRPLTKEGKTTSIFLLSLCIWAVVLGFRITNGLVLLIELVA